MGFTNQNKIYDHFSLECNDCFLFLQCLNKAYFQNGMNHKNGLMCPFVETTLADAGEEILYALQAFTTNFTRLKMEGQLSKNHSLTDQACSFIKGSMKHACRQACGEGVLSGKSCEMVPAVAHRDHVYLAIQKPCYLAVIKPQWTIFPRKRSHLNGGNQQQIKFKTFDTRQWSLLHLRAKSYCATRMPSHEQLSFLHVVVQLCSL